MNNKTVILAAALLGLALTTAPLASASDDKSSMSNVQHRKHMAGPKHPESKEVEPGEKKAPHMSDVQHRKHMGGLHHPVDKQEVTDEEEAHPMSNAQHRKHMGGMKHKSDENTDQE